MTTELKTSTILKSQYDEDEKRDKEGGEDMDGFSIEGDEEEKEEDEEGEGGDFEDEEKYLE